MTSVSALGDLGLPAIQNWSKKQKEGSDLSNILTALGSGKRYTVGWPAAAE